MATRPPRTLCQTTRSPDSHDGCMTTKGFVSNSNISRQTWWLHDHHGLCVKQHHLLTVNKFRWHVALLPFPLPSLSSLNRTLTGPLSPRCFMCWEADDEKKNKHRWQLMNPDGTSTEALRGAELIHDDEDWDLSTGRANCVLKDGRALDVLLMFMAEVQWLFTTTARPRGSKSIQGQRTQPTSSAAAAERRLSSELKAKREEEHGQKTGYTLLMEYFYNRNDRQRSKTRSKRIIRWKERYLLWYNTTCKC